MMMNVGMKRSFHYGDLAHFVKEDYSAANSRKRLRAVSRDDSPDMYSEESTKIEDFFPTTRKREQGNLSSPHRPATLISPNSSTAGVGEGRGNRRGGGHMHPSQCGEPVPHFPMFTAGSDRQRYGSCGACGLVSLPTPALRRRHINNKDAASTDDYSHSYEDQDGDDFVVSFWARPGSQPRKEDYSNSFERQIPPPSSSNGILSHRVSLVTSRKSPCASASEQAPATPTTTPRKQKSIYAPVQDTPSVAQIAATLEIHLRVSSESCSHDAFGSL